MAQLPIREYPDPVLRIKTQPIKVFDQALQTLIDDMIETMYAAPGIGLAAPQVGVSKRMMVIDVSEDQTQPLVFINPEVIEARGEEVMEEGCLSFPGLYATVQRANEIKIRALDRHGKTFELDTGGLLAVCIQHELDHLAGKLFIDYLSPYKRQWLLKKLTKLTKQQAAA